MKKHLLTSLVFSVLFIAIIRLAPIWSREPGGFWNLLFYIIVAALFVIIIVKVIINVKRLFKYSNNFSFKYIIPLVIMIYALFDGIYNPYNINLNKIYGTPVFHSCREGTQNTATFILMDNGKFEVHWTGVFFYDEYFRGNYIKNEDTIIVNFKTSRPECFRDTLIIKDGFIYSIMKDTLLPTHFYLGECRGLN